MIKGRSRHQDPAFTPQILARNLRDIRKARGMTLKQVADLVGCHQTTISGYEIVASVPTEEIVEALCRALGTTRANLVRVAPMRKFSNSGEVRR